MRPQKQQPQEATRWTYVQHKWSNTVHIVCEWENATCHTYCGKFYHPSQSFTPDLSGKREENVVCYACRRLAAAAVGKKVYHRPVLRKGLSEAKRYKLRKEVRAAKERQRLAAWNKAAQEATR